MIRTLKHKDSTPLKCQRCFYNWQYGGNNIYVASCPRCKTTMSIRKHTLLQTGPSLVGPGQSVGDTETASGGGPGHG